jgi:Protein of unknown function (DUF2721)
MDILPNADQLSQIMSHATAPAFILGAVAGFISIMIGRTTTVVDRIRVLHDIPSDADRANLKADIPHLRRRVVLLNSSIRLALASGICTSLLLVVGFLCAFIGLQHVYGVGFLFVVAIVLLGTALFRFAQEVSIGLSESEHYR